MSSPLIGIKTGQQLTMPMAKNKESSDTLSGYELKAIDIRSHWKDLLPIIYSNENVQNIMEKSYQDFQEGFKLKDFKHRYALKGAWSFQDIHQGIYPYTLTTTDWILEFEEKEWYAQANETDKEAKISIINALEKCTKIKGNIWEYVVGKKKIDQFAKKHPAPFPVDLAYDHVISWTNPEELVLDPMCGIGSSCLASKVASRKYLGIDVSKDYCQLTEERLMVYGDQIGGPQSDRIVA